MLPARVLGVQRMHLERQRRFAKSPANPGMEEKRVLLPLPRSLRAAGRGDGLWVPSVHGGGHPAGVHQDGRAQAGGHGQATHGSDERRQLAERGHQVRHSLDGIKCRVSRTERPQRAWADHAGKGVALTAPGAARPQVQEERGVLGRRGEGQHADEPPGPAHPGRGAGGAQDEGVPVRDARVQAWPERQGEWDRARQMVAGAALAETACHVRATECTVPAGVTGPAAAVPGAPVDACHPPRPRRCSWTRKAGAPRRKRRWSWRTSSSTSACAWPTLKRTAPSPSSRPTGSST